MPTIVITDEDLKRQRERNEARAAAARAALGTRYLCHPSNRVKPSPTHSALQVGRQITMFTGGRDVHRSSKEDHPKEEGNRTRW